MKSIKIKIVLVLVFALFYLTVYSINNYSKNKQISVELKSSVENLRLNYDITNYHNRKSADSVYYTFAKNKELIKLLSQSLDANAKQKDILRKKLYKMLDMKFDIMKSKGIKILLFAHPDDTTFLRMHNPDKFGDKLNKIRYGITQVNKIKKIVHGFEQGKISHAFRNIYPLFDDNNRYLGCFDIAYSSENMQDTLSDINKIHSHFLVNKKVINAKIWKTKEIKSNYSQSIEHKDYMISAISETVLQKQITSKKIVSKHQKIIKTNIDNSKEFAVYDMDNNKAIIISFIPIMNILKDKNAVAYIVSYTQNIKIQEILNLYNIINVIAFLLGIIAIYFIYNQIMHKENLKFEVDEKTKELKDLNENLEHRIIIESEKNREKDKILYEQAKNIQMSELIENIAHQWRQPLSVISTVSSGLSVKIDYGVFEEAEAKKDLDILSGSAQFLSKTIDTFSYLLKEEKDLKEIVLQDAISYAIEVIDATLKNNYIKLINNIDYSNSTNITLVVGDLSQVLINIFNNAKDVLLEKSTKDKWIKIELEIKDNIVVITIEDNGGGIPKEIISKIFNPYFTTKHQSQGTGLGLHMCQEIIRKNLHGKLYAKNTNDGAKFYIELPLDS